MEQPAEIQLATEMNEGSIVAWSDDKRKEFVATFENRSKAAQYILLCTAAEVYEKAKQRHLVGSHAAAQRNVNFFYTHPHLFRRGHCEHVGDRSVADLSQIASERAELILAELPPVKKALEVIDRETAKRMDRKDEIVAALKAEREKLEEFSGHISMAELDQKMTIGEFRKMVKTREKKRDGIATRMNELAKEGNELDDLIHKSLFKGVPGLCEAVLKVVDEYMQRASMMETTCRRVTELVMFGDSKQALEMLKMFEKDELEVGDNIKAEFQKALEKLKVKGLKGKAKKK